LMTAVDSEAMFRRQLDVVARAIEGGIDWFDTAAGYGDGRSERALGRVLQELDARHKVQVATKVRLTASDLEDIPEAVERSLRESLDRLRLPRVALLQLHNSITDRRGQLPTSLAVDDVLGPGGVLDGLERVRRLGLTELVGLTGLGESRAVEQVIRTGRFHTLQLPLNALSLAFPQESDSAIGELPPAPIIALCASLGMGVFAIRVFAGGALALAPPSEYTHVTKFFTLDVYQRDVERARKLVHQLPQGTSLPEFAVRKVLSYRGVSAAILGFGSPSEIDEALRGIDGADPEEKMSH
ncbi:MAG: aldo/keto reductase, partial [Planctomycetota bacterium]|nr:aldo/keto reductase [Planctomycetota bacterium]